MVCAPIAITLRRYNNQTVDYSITTENVMLGQLAVSTYVRNCKQLFYPFDDGLYHIPLLYIRLT